MNGLYHTTFPNGLRFFAQPMAGTHAATIYVVYQVGSRYETDRVAGISHFLEHMIFKGTKKRPTARTVTRELDSLGAEYNAMTSKDWTGYYIKVSEEYFDHGLEILADVLLNSTFQKGAIERERKVIVQEMRMYEDNPVFHIEDVFEQRIFGKTPLGRDIAGFKKSVMGMTSRDLHKFWDTYYHPRNMIVVATGAIKPKQVEAQLKKYFGKLKAQRRLPFFSCRYHQKEPQMVLVNKKVEQAQVALGFNAYNYEDPRLSILDVMHGLLGAGMSSRLFEKIRENMGLAYSVNTAVISYEDQGAFYVRAGLDSKKTLPAIKEILRQLEKFKNNLVTNEELKRAKQFLTGNIALQLEGSDSYAGWLAKQALFMPKIENVEDIVEKINAVTRKDLRDVAQEIMVPESLNLAVIGPFTDTKPFEKLLSSFS